MELQEFEYIRHGAQCFMINFEVAMATRAELLSDPSHRIVFHYTPNHASWMNQVEIWFSILTRKLLNRGNFTSVEYLIAKVLAFIEY